MSDATLTPHQRIHIDRAEGVDDRRDLRELREGLEHEPREISSRFFYDETGSALFERICTLPEYYQTRTEHLLLERRAGDLIDETAAEELVEIGSGAATKTRALLDAMHRRGRLRRYLPLDVDESMLERVAEELCTEYPELHVYAIGGDFVRSLGRLPPGGRRLFVFLGGTIGNLRPDDEAPEFLSLIRRDMTETDWLLLGTDLIKDRARLEAAYNDSQGVTAAFNRNILSVVNQRFDGDFSPDLFEHRAFWNPQERWIEMHLVARTEQTVRIGALELEIRLRAGEPIRTEISAKYDRERTEVLLGRADLELADWLVDSDDLFALSLARPSV